MYIKILRVYKNSEGKQIGVKADVNGQCSRLNMVQLRDLVSRGYEPVNFTFYKNGVKGKGCNLEYLEWLTKKEMRVKYRGKWVAVVDGIYEDDNIIYPLISGAVLAAVSVDDYSRRYQELRDKGAIFEKMPGDSILIPLR